MPASSRVVFRREFRITPVWLWIMQRASALLLGPLVLLHGWGPAGLRGPALDGLLLIIVVAHGFSGCSRLHMRGSNHGALSIVGFIWSAVVLVAGLLILIPRL
jgi:hypothetical protein